MSSLRGAGGVLVLEHCEAEPLWEEQEFTAVCPSLLVRSPHAANEQTLLQETGFVGKFKGRFVSTLMTKLSPGGFFFLIFSLLKINK